MRQKTWTEILLTWFIVAPCLTAMAQQPDAQILFPNTDYTHFKGTELSLIAFSSDSNATYRWTLSTGETLEGQSASILLNGAGPVTISMVATNGQGQSSVPDTRIVFLQDIFTFNFQPKIAVLEPSRGAIHPGQNFTIAATIQDADRDGPYQFHWFWLENERPRRAEGVNHLFSLGLSGQDPTDYRISLIVVDQAGNPSQAMHTQVQVTNGNLPPSGRIIEPAQGFIDVLSGQTVHFVAEGSDPEGNLPLRFRWLLPGNGIVAGATVDFTFTEVGTSVVVLQTTDSLGNQDPVNRTVLVNVIDPASFQAPDTFILLPLTSTRIFEGESLILSGLIAGANPESRGYWEVRNLRSGATMTRLEGNQPGRVLFPHAGLFEVDYRFEQFGQVSQPTTSNTRWIAVHRRDSNSPPRFDLDPSSFPLTPLIPNGGVLTFTPQVFDPDDDEITLFWVRDGVLQPGSSSTRTFTFDLPEDAFFKGVAVSSIELLALDAREKAPNQPLSLPVFVFQDRIPPRPVINDLATNATVFHPVGEPFPLDLSILRGEGLNLIYRWNAIYLDNLTQPVLSSTDRVPAAPVFTRPGLVSLSVDIETADGRLRNDIAHAIWVYVYDPAKPPQTTITNPNIPELEIETGTTLVLEGLANEPNRFPALPEYFSFQRLVTNLTWEILGPGNFLETYRQNTPLSLNLTAPGDYTVALKATNQIGLADPEPDTLALRVVGLRPDQQFEPNDTRATAADLGFGNYAGLSVGPGDPVDWYRFHLDQAGSAIELVFDLSAATDPAAITVFQGEIQVQQATLSAGRKHPFTFVGARAGDYYLQLRQQGTGSAKRALAFGFSVSVSNPRLAFSYPKTDAVDLTHLTLVNPTGSEARSTLVARDKNGAALAEAQMDLAPRGAAEKSIEELFSGVDMLEIAWVQVRSDQNIIGMSTTIARDELTALAEPAIIGGLDELIIPHIAQETAQWFTQATVINISGETVETRFNAQAGAFEIDDFKDVYQRSLIDFESFFGGSLPAGSEWGSFVEAAAQPGLTGMELFGTKLGSPRVAGLNLGSEKLRNPNFVYQNRDIYFPHVAKDTASFWTGIAFVNTAAEPADVLLVAYDETGAVLAEQPIVMEGFAKRVGLAYTLFESLDSESPIAWIQLRTTGPVQGYELFGDNGGEASLLAGFPALSGGAKEVVFQKILFEAGKYWTGLATVNLSSDQTAALTYEVFGGDGTLLATANRQIGPYRKDVALIEQIFGGSLPAGASWVRLRSDQPIAAFELFGDSANKFLAGTIAQ